MISSQTCTQASRFKEENTVMRTTNNTSSMKGNLQWCIAVPGTRWIKLATMALKCARISLRISTSLSFSASKSMRVRSTYSKNKAPRAKVSRSKAPLVLEQKETKLLDDWSWCQSSICFTENKVHCQNSHAKFVLDVHAVYMKKTSSLELF